MIKRVRLEPRRDELLQRGQPRQHHDDEDGRAHRLDVGLRAEGHADGRHHPDRGRARQAGDRAPRVEDRAGADEAHAGQDLGRDPAGIASLRRHAHGEDREQGGSDADEDVGAEAGGLSLQLPLEADGAAQQDGEDELDEQLQPQRLRPVRE